LTGSGKNLKLSKVHHPGLPAKEIRARVGDVSDENFVRMYASHGIESRPEPEEAPKPKAKPEEPKRIHVLEKTIVPGLLPK
jgi:hypothetical protein